MAFIKNFKTSNLKNKKTKNLKKKNDAEISHTVKKYDEKVLFLKLFFHKKYFPSFYKTKWEKIYF